VNPLWTLLPPLAVIPFIIFFGEKRRNLRELSIVVAGIILLMLNNGIYSDLLNGVAGKSGAFDMMGGLTLALSAEPLGNLFALLASFLWIVTTIYSIGYMRGHKERNQTRFYTCFAIAIAAVMGAAYADNLLTLFVAYEVITLSTYPLVTHAGTEKARRGGKIYLTTLMSTSIALFMPAVIWTWLIAGTTTFTVGGIIEPDSLSGFGMGLLLALFVFGIAKAAIMPFHRWLPAAMVAPTPVSALLHAVAVVKTGVFALLKIATYTFGVDTIATIGSADWLLWLAAFTVLSSSLVAFSKDNLKARLAYSTVSQLSYIIAAALLGSSIAITGGAMHIVMHGFGKITLFFCAGAIMVAAHKTEISELDGLGKTMPLTLLAFTIGALSIIGLPPAAGMWSKLMIAQGTLENGQYWLIAVLMFSTLLNIGYLLEIPLRAFFRSPRAGHDHHHHDHDAHDVDADDTVVDIAGQPAFVSAGWQEAPAPSLWAILMTATVVILLFFYPAPLLELLELVQWR